MRYEREGGGWKGDGGGGQIVYKQYCNILKHQIFDDLEMTSILQRITRNIYMNVTGLGEIQEWRTSIVHYINL